MADNDWQHWDDGSRLLFRPGFVPRPIANRCLEQLLSTIDWQQRAGLFGRPQPRLIASQGDLGVTYRYSGADYPAAPWTEVMGELKTLLEQVAGPFNYCLMNRYRSGTDSMGWHADDEPEMGPVIGSLSLGAARTFRLRHNVSRETRSYVLGHGDLLVMAGTMQQHWQHALPKTQRVVGERVNLTFRQIVARSQSARSR